MVYIIEEYTSYVQIRFFNDHSSTFAVMFYNKGKKKKVIIVLIFDYILINKNIE